MSVKYSMMSSTCRENNFNFRLQCKRFTSFRDKHFIIKPREFSLSTTVMLSITLEVMGLVVVFDFQLK